MCIPLLLGNSSEKYYCGHEYTHNKRRMVQPIISCVVHATLKIVGD
jgi:hypothetical protein